MSSANNAEVSALIQQQVERWSSEERFSYLFLQSTLLVPFFTGREFTMTEEHNNPQTSIERKKERTKCVSISNDIHAIASKRHLADIFGLLFQLEHDASLISEERHRYCENAIQTLIESCVDFFSFSKSAHRSKSIFFIFTLVRKKNYLLRA